MRDRRQNTRAKTLNKAVFLDRDGTINFDSGYVHRPQDLVFLPGVIQALRLFRQAGYLLIVVTNQSGIARGYFTERQAEAFHRAMRQRLEEQGIVLDDILMCPHGPQDGCSCRKPSPQMVLDAITKHDIDPRGSYLFGDKESDIECGRRSHVAAYRVTNEHSLLYWANHLITK